MINNQFITICGGAGLLGTAFCKHLASEHNLIVADFNLEAAKALCDELKATNHSGTFIPVEVNITSTSSVENLIKFIEEKSLDVIGLVNNAYPRNKNYGKHFFDVEYDDFCENISMNVGGYFLMCKHFAAYFTKKNVGNIVNISSIYGHFTPDFSVYKNTPMTMPVEYTAIKASINNLTKYIAKYLKGTGVRVNSLSPGGIFDNQNPEFVAAYNEKCLSKGMLSANDLCGSLAFLLSDKSKYINGQNIIVDDGFTL